jgi:hypothetical protein
MRPDLGNKERGYNTSDSLEAAELKNISERRSLDFGHHSLKFAASAPSRSSEGWLGLLKGPRFRANVGK